MDRWVKENKVLTTAIVCLLLLWLFLLVTDRGLLLSEKKVEPGESYIVDDYGDLGKSSQGSFVCRYFNGRKIVTDVYWYSPNNIFGRDSCPFLREV